jgi:type II secretory pathway pseudopilin PulG
MVGRISLKSKESFTLIEVIIIVIIMSILLISALPNTRGVIRKLKTERQVYSIVTFLRYAQELAVRKLFEKAVVTLYPEEGELTLSWEKKPKVLKKLKLPSEIEFTSNAKGLYFDGFGNIFISNEKKTYLINTTIDVKDKYGKKYRINITTTGYIGIKYFP